jgi:hypothetical protein
MAPRPYPGCRTADSAAAADTSKGRNPVSFVGDEPGTRREQERSMSAFLPDSEHVDDFPRAARTRQETTVPRVPATPGERRRSWWFVFETWVSVPAQDDEFVLA